ncbi:MAG TPA: hypothetical protein VK816_00480 [Jatrophihabitantaceae bacterium]|jgi:hypothetical protein|nr:hypothetical protein [Jatrophihabitantaceae bacterium]
MAVQTRLRVPFGDVFPMGAYMVGEVEAVEDFDLVKAAREAGKEPGDVQIRDKVTGLRVWAVRIIDADPEARKGQTELVVKVSADVQPVPPAAVPGMPFRQVEFENLTLTPYLDESRARPRLAFSLRSTGFKSTDFKAADKPVAPKAA